MSQSQSQASKGSKGGKPSRGTPADRRLAENKPKPTKKPFPGAAPPFKPAKAPTKPKKS